uniref:Liver-expressed antimicrobial peptide 2 n=1 Tax=Sinocyclocheilus anshuiensis TaxID=1608454 RepID=A0A671RTU2_9TELE
MEGQFCHGIKKLKSNCDFFFSSHNSEFFFPLQLSLFLPILIFFFSLNFEKKVRIRSLLWRWNTLKPVGSGCRDHYECGTNYCLYCSLVHVSINYKVKK